MQVLLCSLLSAKMAQKLQVEILKEPENPYALLLSGILHNTCYILKDIWPIKPLKYPLLCYVLPKWPANGTWCARSKTTCMHFQMLNQEATPIPPFRYPSPIYQPIPFKISTTTTTILFFHQLPDQSQGIIFPSSQLL